VACRIQGSGSEVEGCEGRVLDGPASEEKGPKEKGLQRRRVREKKALRDKGREGPAWGKRAAKDGPASGKKGSKGRGHQWKRALRKKDS
jgi:hypothetical protein